MSPASTLCLCRKELKNSRRANDESILAIQIFDQKKFKKKDQGFLGVINVKIGSVMDFETGGDGRRFPFSITSDR